MRNFKFFSVSQTLSGVLILLFLMTTTNSSAIAARKSAAMAIDAHTGRILYSHNIDKPHHPASLTKIMTLYMLFEFIQAGRLTMDSPLTVTVNATRQAPSSLRLKAGSTIRVEDAIKSLVTKSANDVAVTIAENLAGTEWKFTQLMTWKARKFGMHNTQFVNASGLPNKRQTTTARDMITLSMRIQKDFPQFYPYFSIRKFKYKRRTYRNHNGLMSRMKGIDGIKTGYTRASGYNLTTSIWKGRKHVVAVVLGGKTARKRDVFMARVLKKTLPKARNGKTKKQFVTANFASKSKTRTAAKNAVRPIKPVATRKKLVKAQAVKQSASKQQPVKISKKDQAQLPVSKSKPQAEKKTASLTTPPQGPYHIQVGAFGNEADAERSLHSIGSKANLLLKGHRSFTMLVPSNNVYRARFAGFSKTDAKNTCSQLKKQAIDCMAVSAQH